MNNLSKSDQFILVYRNLAHHTWGWQTTTEVVINNRIEKGVQIMKLITTALAVLTAVSVSSVYAQTGASDGVIRNSMGMPARQMEPIPDASSNWAVAVGMGFTYQGTLDDGGVPANGEYDIQFTLTDETGSVMAGPICMDNVTVIDGLFTVELDFGAQFYGDARELEMAVRPGGALGNCGSGGYTALSPRQKLNATPYALGIRLPYSGSQAINGDTFSILNNSTLPNDASIRGILGGVSTFGFSDRAGIRGETNGMDSAGVLGISDQYIGVVGYSAGDFGVGVFGRTDATGGVGLQGWAFGDDSKGMYAFASGLNSWAGYFEGRVFVDGLVGIGTNAPTTALDVNGTTKTDAFAMPTGAGTGKVLTSDAFGNGTWQDNPGAGTAGFYSAGPGVFPLAATQFLSTTVTVTISAGQQIYVDANQTFGSVAVGGAGSLDLYVGYRVAGSGATPTLLGAGMFNIAVPQGVRMPFGISGVISNLPAGTYEVGMAGDDDGNGNWDNGEWGYVSALVLD